METAECPTHGTYQTRAGSRTPSAGAVRIRRKGRHEKEGRLNLPGFKRRRVGNISILLFPFNCLLVVNNSKIRRLFFPHHEPVKIRFPFLLSRNKEKKPRLSPFSFFFLHFFGFPNFGCHTLSFFGKLIFKFSLPEF